ncbi:MAG: hypothetical protein M3N04_04835 [Actinomycetota bacterium]|nr:hypothetical protein [Actinomycetota bacterium]
MDALHLSLSPLEVMGGDPEPVAEIEPVRIGTRGPDTGVELGDKVGQDLRQRDNVLHSQEAAPDARIESQELISTRRARRRPRW